LNLLPGTAPAMIEPGPALLMLALIVAMVVYAFKRENMEYFIRTHHPQAWGYEDRLRNLLLWRFWTDIMVFPHRRLRASLESEGVRDKALDARIASLVRWNRLAIVLFLVTMSYGLAINW